MHCVGVCLIFYVKKEENKTICNIIHCKHVFEFFSFHNELIFDSHQRFVVHVNTHCKVVLTTLSSWSVFCFEWSHGVVNPHLPSAVMKQNELHHHNKSSTSICNSWISAGHKIAAGTQLFWDLIKTDLF